MKEKINNQRITLAFLSFIFFILSSSLYAQSSAKGKSSKIRIQPVTFTHFFPDTAFAEAVAEELNKKITDYVTIKELASIKGDFGVGPEGVSNLTGIRYLTGIDTFYCLKNDVTEIPAEIGKLTNLTFLNLNKAFSLKKIPPEIGELKSLKTLQLDLTEVKSIPKEIGNLTQLESLLICCNELTEIPKEIGQLKNLKELDIHSNTLKTIPDEICNLTSLTSLDIRDCGLERLPENIGDLKNLQTLNLFGNNLKYLPKSIAQLENLSYLNVFDNFKLSESYKKYLPERLRKKK